MSHNETTLSAYDVDQASAIRSVQAAIRLMNELVKVMQEEAIILEQRKFKQHSEILKTKQRLTLDYRATIKTFAAQPDLLKKMPEEVRRAAREAAQKLTDVAERNARTLRSAVIAVQRLLQSIISIVKAETLPKGSYKNPQTERFKIGTYSPTCKPVAVTRIV